MTNTKHLYIQQAREADLEKILQLQKACYQQEAEIYNDFQIPPLTQTLASIKEDFKKQVFLKYEIDREIVGSVRGEIIDDTCKIGRLIVAASFQNRGIGSQLMHSIETFPHQVRRFELFTGHLSEKNLGLYRKLGYSQIKIQPVNDRLKLIFMEKLYS